LSVALDGRSGGRPFGLLSDNLEQLELELEDTEPVGRSPQMHPVLSPLPLGIGVISSMTQILAPLQTEY
jgi:hypothetical protein